MEAATINKIQKETGWSKELLYQLVDNVKDYAIFVSDLDGHIVSWNIGAEKIFGYSAEEVIGQNCRILFTEEDQVAGVPEKEKETAREKGCAEDDRWHIRQDGSFFYANGVMTALFDETGKHTGYAKIARDITEQLTLKDELQAAYDSLEIKVRERTSKLTDSNESLRLEVNARKQSEKLRTILLQRIVRAQEDERKRIAREIHDSIGQAITGLQLKLQSIIERYKDDSELNNQHVQLQAMAQQIDSEVDFLAWELRPSILDDFGLTAAMKKYVHEWSVHFQIPAEFDQIGIDGKKLLPEIETNLYRLGQEALNNIAKHAKASNVSVLLEQKDSKVMLIIEDDGIGFKPHEKAELSEDARGLGLLGMKERAELIGGSFDIESSPGIGTTVYVRVPAQFSDEEKV
jgi:PAS domain S-box-containing protein